MPGVSYVDLDLLIQVARSQYRAHILNAPAGQVAADFALTVSAPEFQDLMSQVRSASIDAQMDAAKKFGGVLFSALFAGEIGICLRSSLEQASMRGVGLRIRLRFDEVPELSALPWEYLYDPTLDRFLALSTQTPLVRYLELPERIRPFPVQTPLRILVMVADVAGLPVLDGEREWMVLREALADLERRALVKLERLDPASLGALQERLRRGIFHVFHFAGHGAVDPQTGDGVLNFVDEVGQTRAITGTDLATLFHDHVSLRLALLNACETAQVSSLNAFAGVAPKLVRQGIPAVIAMQASFSDRTAVVFAREFYAAVADGYSVDAAMSEARKAAFALGGAEWGIPVLYMRVPDGQVFALERKEEGGEEVDPANLATTVVGLLTPFLAKGAETAAGKGDEAVVEKVRALHSSLKGWLHGDPYAEQTLRRLEDQPTTEARQTALVGVLEETIKADPAFGRALQKMLEKDQVAGTEAITQDIAVSGQAKTGNIIQIGKVDGNIDLDKLLRRR